MKWRNQMLALVCLCAFVALGIVYFQNWVVQKPFAIVLFVAEGFTARDLAMTRLYAGGADARLAFDAMPHLGLLMNASSDFAVPDQAAAATALATGEKVNTGSVAINANGERLITLLELAEERGRATGLVSDSSLTNPVCAAFFAHANDVNDQAEIAQRFADEHKIDIVLGGGASSFMPETKGGARHDGRDVLLELRSNGYDIVQTRSELENVPAWRRGRLFGVFANADLAFSDQLQEANEQPAFADMVRRAIELLQYNRRGYLLVAHAGLMGKAAAENQGERRLRELAELDRALGVARRYAGQNATIIVCGEVAIGGMALNGTPFRRDHGIAVMGLNARGEPSVTWATGPNGLTTYATSKLPDEKSDAPVTTPPTEPAAFYSQQARSVAEDVLALGSGVGTERLRGVRENTEVFAIVRDNL